MLNNTGLYIRRRDTNELWQLFLGGYTQAKPSDLYRSYLTYFRELHSDYEWVVLERRLDSRNHRAMYRVGDTERVDVVLDSDELGDVPDRQKAKQVECLSLWHMDEDNKLFRGSISNRVCPRCYTRERKWHEERSRDERRDGFSETGV